MSPFTISLKTEGLVPRWHLAFTRRNLLANPLTQDLVPLYSALLEKWSQTYAVELELSDQVDEGTLLVSTADLALNQFAKRVSKEILILTDDDRGHPLYTHYFGDKPLHVFIRPILSDQLTAMRAWGKSLTSSEHATLKALGAELPALIKAADDAVTAKATAVENLDNFREVGERKKFYDEVNATRKETHGFLATLPHKHTGLPSNFADRFFRRARVRSEVEDEPTVESVKEKLTKLLGEVQAQEKLLAKLENDEAQAAKEAAEKSAKKAKLEAIEKEMAAKQKEANALRAELE